MVERQAELAPEMAMGESKVTEEMAIQRREEAELNVAILGRYEAEMNVAILGR